MAKLLRSELENIRGEEMESFLKQRRVQLSTTPLGAAPGKVIAYVSRSVPWKKRGKVPKNLHLTQG
ncbi:hypothetical protein ES703_112108 [subsurface metagenome]